MSIPDTFTTLDRQLGEEVARDPLHALSAIGQARRIIDSRQRLAVRAAVQSHSWAEIGEAMGVTRQAAHQKFARAWIDEIKAEIKATTATFKSATRKGDDAGASAAKARLDELVSEVKRGKPKRT